MTLLAAIASLTITLALPGSYYAAARFRLIGAIEVSARLQAAEIAELARRNPQFWELDGVVVAASDVGRRAGSDERRRVYDIADRLVIESFDGAKPEWPVVTRHAPVVDEDRWLGRVEAARSLRPTLVTTGLIALGSSLLGILIFLLLRVFPLRMLRRALDKVTYLATHDALTGLPNRSLFAEQLTAALAADGRAGLAVLCLDLDRFKEVNDTLGHPAGDLLLREVARRLTEALEPGETLARLGGDEFAVIQSKDGRAATAEALARRLRASLEPVFDLQGHGATIGASIGIALAPPGESASPEQLLMDADVALYQVKESGRGNFQIFHPDMNRQLGDRRRLEADLRRAVAEGAFRLHYQPQIDLATGRVIGAEALLRWNRPDHGMVSPDSFVRVAEEAGLIGAIGSWVLVEACRRAANWPAHMRVSVNVSAAQCRQPGLRDTVARALAAAALAPDRLELEITETVLLSDTEQVLTTLKELHALGVRIAMDDFGTGYSSLSYLQRFRFDKIKIDRSFVGQIGRDPRSEAIIRATMGIARALGVQTNAEGVEHEDQAAFLRQEGCHEAQGYLFGRPIPADEFEHRFAAAPAADAARTSARASA